MAHTIEKTLSCMGCGLGCRINYDGYTKMDFCTDKKLIVWPEDNYYFKLALNELIFKSCPCYLSEGVVVIDFSIRNIALFINDEWLKFLRQTAMSIILVADRRMVAIANYWFRESDNIKAIIKTEDGIEEFTKEFKKILCGRCCIRVKAPAVTAREMYVLNMISHGINTNEIATKLNCSVKNVYVHKSALKKKMGDNITSHMLSNQY